jgi:high-affinity nickel permease
MQAVYIPPLQRGTSVTLHIVSLPKGDFVQLITLLPIRKKWIRSRSNYLMLSKKTVCITKRHCMSQAVPRKFKQIDTPQGVYPFGFVGLPGSRVILERDH